jgi:glutathione S-transferase
MHPNDALTRARHRAWIDYATQTFAEAWQFLHAKDETIADAKRAAFRDRLSTIEAALVDGPYFAGADFSLVDAVYAPLFRYFGIVDPLVSDPIFVGLPRVTAWRVALAERPSVRDAVIDIYPDLFRDHLHQHGAMIAA